MKSAAKPKSTDRQGLTHTNEPSKSRNDNDDPREHHPHRHKYSDSQQPDSQAEDLNSVYENLLAFASRHRDMAATFGYNSNPNQRPQPHSDPYMNTGFYGLASTIATHAPGNLSILNSDTYDDGRLDMSAQHAREVYSRARVEQERVIPMGITDNKTGNDSDGSEKAPKGRSSRKRKQESVNGDDDEEARKRARGRPRVDPKDETAADRRRTQIRMAQRAYRNRKETTITTLEKQVQDLKSTNEEMSNIFNSLYDAAVRKGLLQREPNFGHQLQSTTERFLALVKTVSNEDESREDSGKEVENVTPEAPKKMKAARPPPNKVQEEAPLFDEVPTQPVQPWGGYTVVKEQSLEEEMPMSFAQQSHDTGPYQNESQSIMPPTEDYAGFQLHSNQQNYDHADLHNGLQIITRPTEDNASFPFYDNGAYHNELQVITRPTEDNASFPFYDDGAQHNELQVITRPPEDNASFGFHDNGVHHNDIEIIARPSQENASFQLDSQNFRVGAPLMEDFSHLFLPYTQPALPITMADSQEFSFARRLQRLTLERALGLLRMQYPPPGRWNKVFGFVSIYETKAETEHRILTRLWETANGTLSTWTAPFSHVGGAGTFYPGETAAEMMPNFRTGYSMGPNTTRVSRAQEMIGDNMQCSMPGFEGQFYDSMDVEGWVRGRGIEIPATADYVTAEIDVSELESSSGTSSTTQVSPRTPESPLSGGAANSGMKSHDPGQKMFTFPGSVFTPWNIESTPSANVSMQNGTSFSASISGTSSIPRKETVTVDVNLFISSLINQGSCLGRAPAFKPRDVKEALLNSIISRA